MMSELFDSKLFCKECGEDYDLFVRMFNRDPNVLLIKCEHCRHRFSVSITGSVSDFYNTMKVFVDHDDKIHQFAPNSVGLDYRNKGRRVRLLYHADGYTELDYRDEGTYDHANIANNNLQHDIKWDNGFNHALLSSIDAFEFISDPPIDGDEDPTPREEFYPKDTDVFHVLDGRIARCKYMYHDSCVHAVVEQYKTSYEVARSIVNKWISSRNASEDVKFDEHALYGGRIHNYNPIIKNDRSETIVMPRIREFLNDFMKDTAKTLKIGTFMMVEYSILCSRLQHEYHVTIQEAERIKDTWMKRWNKTKQGIRFIEDNDIRVLEDNDRMLITRYK